MENKDKFFTIQEIADFLRVNKITIYRMAKKRAIPALKVGRQWRFEKKLIQRWIESQEGQFMTKKEDE